MRNPRRSVSDHNSSPAPNNSRATTASIESNRGLRRRDMALDYLNNLLFRHGAHDLIRHQSALKDQQRRYAADVKFPGDAHVVVDIQLYDLELSLMLACDLFDGRRQHFARPAPVSPEIDHHRLSLAGFDYVRLKAGVGYGWNVVCHYFPFFQTYPARPAERYCATSLLT